MRVLHVHSGNLYGGVEAILVTLARYQDLYPQMESHFALCFEGRLSEELLVAGAPVYRLGKTRLRQLRSVMRGRRILKDLVARGSFDLGICHSGWSQAIFGPVFRSAALPLVVWFHNPTNGRNWLDRWGSLTEPELALCNSKFTAKAMSDQYPHVRAEVVYCPVANQPTSSAENRRVKRAELQTPEDATVIIQVSRMEAWKGQSLHLEALSQIKELPDWICWQVGGTQRPQEVQYREHLEQLSRRLGIAERVRFLDQRSDVQSLLRAADIYCQPNAGAEPFGIAFVEALYAGLPVVTTAIGGATEIVDDSCGVLAPCADPVALASSLRRLIQDPVLRHRLGDAGPERARKLCDPQTQMKRLNEVLASVKYREAKA